MADDNTPQGLLTQPDTEQPADPMDAEFVTHTKRYMEDGHQGYEQRHWDHVEKQSPGISKVRDDLHTAFESDMGKVPHSQRAEAMMFVDSRDDLRDMSYAQRHQAITKMIGDINKHNKDGDKYNWSAKTIAAVATAFGHIKRTKGGKK